MAIKHTEFDQVHDIQRAFRKTVGAFSFPGRVVDIDQESTGQDFEAKAPRALFIIARMLLDTETTFACWDEPLAGTLELLTFAKRTEVSRADYIFATRNDTILEALREGKSGTLIDPHDASLVVALADIGNEDREWILSGPGIEVARTCRFSLPSGWEGIRSERNREFPLGIDLLLVSDENSVLALPRTTQIRPGSL